MGNLKGRITGWGIKFELPFSNIKLFFIHLLFREIIIIEDSDWAIFECSIPIVFEHASREFANESGGKRSTKSENKAFS